MEGGGWAVNQVGRGLGLTTKFPHGSQLLKHFSIPGDKELNHIGPFGSLGDRLLSPYLLDKEGHH